MTPNTSHDTSRISDDHGNWEHSIFYCVVLSIITWVCAFMPTPYMPTPHMPTNKISVRLCLRKQSECYYDSLSEITDDKFNTGYHNE